jgi:ActR/RegA family two-component response regulator
MGLDCLLVTGDPALLAQIKAAFTSRAASIDLRQDSASAIELAARRHLDGLVIDCDDTAGGTEALAKVRESRSNKDTLIIAVVNGLTGAGPALDLGASFVLCKPIPETRLQSVLDIAFPRMECEHRRYFRYNADLRVRLRNHLEQTVTARIKNVSESGLAIRLADPVHLKGVVPVEFDIPSIEPQLFRAKADIVWSDSFEMGLRYLYIEKDSEIALKSWLGLLEAQSQLREPNSQVSHQAATF